MLVVSRDWGNGGPAGEITLGVLSVVGDPIWEGVGFAGKSRREDDAVAGGHKWEHGGPAVPRVGEMMITPSRYSWDAILAEQY